MTEPRYPVLREDIFFAKIETLAGIQVKIRNTTTQKDFSSNPPTVALLDLCTGVYTAEEIVNKLSQAFNTPPEELANDVEKILTVLQEKGAVTVNSTPLHTPAEGAKYITTQYPPESAQIEITNACNLSCMHCINNSGKPYPNELTSKEILTVIDALSSLGVHTLTLSGGEPLLHPDLFTIIGHARRAPMTVDIFTNGTLITGDHIKKFGELQVRGVSISIDSITESIHDTFRGQKGALRKTLNALKLLKDAGFSLKPSISLTQMNKTEIIPILQYLKDENLPDFQIFPVKITGRHTPGLAVSPEEYYRISVEQFQYLTREFPEGILRFYPRDTQGCGIGTDRIGVKADGTILPCPGSFREMGVGNIRDTTLLDVWNTNEVELYRNVKIEDDSTCSRCQHLIFCQGCIAGAFITEGTFRCYDPYVCALYRAYDEVIGLK